MNTQLDLLEERMIARFEQIDTSLNLVARELARRDADQPSD
jgi:hypothetical protein